jgi:hypothetical protein
MDDIARERSLGSRGRYTAFKSETLFFARQRGVFANLASLGLGLLFLNLHLDNVTWMLNDFRNESLMSTPYFPRDSLCQVDAY